MAGIFQTSLVASLYRDLYQAADILQSNQIAERTITKF